MCTYGHAYLHTQMYTHGNNTGIHTVWPRLAWKLMILLPQCYDYRLESHKPGVGFLGLFLLKMTNRPALKSRLWADAEDPGIRLPRGESL